MTATTKKQAKMEISPRSFCRRFLIQYGIFLIGTSLPVMLANAGAPCHDPDMDKIEIPEALLNSVAHKMYSSGIPIQVSIYDDKMYIANIGKLPETWTVENLLNKHVSKPYNPGIAHVFYLAGFIESWGRWIEKIYDACRKDGIPDPEYTIHPEDIMIKFTAPEERVIRIAQQRLQNKVTDKVTDGVTDKVTDSEMTILTLLLEDPAYSYTQLAEKASVSRKTIALKMKKLQDRGIITRIGSSKRGYWKINENFEV